MRSLKARTWNYHGWHTFSTLCFRRHVEFHVCFYPVSPPPLPHHFYLKLALHLGSLAHSSYLFPSLGSSPICFSLSGQGVPPTQLLHLSSSPSTSFLAPSPTVHGQELTLAPSAPSCNRGLPQKTLKPYPPTAHSGLKIPLYPMAPPPGVQHSLYVNYVHFYCFRRRFSVCPTL